MAYDTGIANRLRFFGLKVVEVNGWQTRGNPNWNPKGSVDHHTAGPRTGNAPSLNVCINGRSDLPGPLCNVLIGRDNTCYVIAAGRANHAGTGGWGGLTGNSSVFGVERENVGDGSEPWTLQQYDVAAKCHAALIASVGQRSELVCEHKEWAPRRKIDAYGVDGAVMRQLVKDRLTPHPTVPPSPPAPPAPAPSNPDAEFLKAVADAAKGRPVIREGDKGPWVKDLQEGINQIVGSKVLTPDGNFGPNTTRWVKQFQKDRGLKPDGIVGVGTWQHIISARLGR
jgi:hypothetical protein